MVAALEAGEGSQREIAERFGVGRGAVGYWLKKLGRVRGPRRPRAVRLLPVRVVTQVADRRVEVLAGDGIAIRLAGDVDPEYVAAIVSALRSC